jgi:hypothetical protein
LPGVAEITCRIILSDTPDRNSFRTSAFAGASAKGCGGGGTLCCANAVAEARTPAKITAAIRIYVLLLEIEARRSVQRKILSVTIRTFHFIS